MGVHEAYAFEEVLLLTPPPPREQRPHECGGNGARASWTVQEKKKKNTLLWYSAAASNYVVCGFHDSSRSWIHAGKGRDRVHVAADFILPSDFVWRILSSTGVVMDDHSAGTHPPTHTL